MMCLRARRSHANAVPPKRATQQAACWDVSACLQEDVKVQVMSAWNELHVRQTQEQQITLFGGERALIPTGWTFDIPSGYSLRIHPRSGLAWKQGISLANAEGVIDSDYIQQTFVLLWNTTEAPCVIRHGDRIAQLELVPVLEFQFEESESEILTKTDRQGGFGSTGLQA
jgi:dUTP pyrophosphatase